MYQPKKIQQAFIGAVGFLPPNDPNTPPITGTLLTSASGIFVNNVHSLCTLDYLYLACPDFTATKWPQWATGSNYAINEVVSFLSPVTGKYGRYFAVAAITGSIVDPITAGTGVWGIFNPWQNYVQQLYDQASSNLIGAVIQKKKLSYMGKAILERQQLYRGLGDYSNTIVGMGNFVGFEARPASAEGLLLIVELIGIQSTLAQDEMNYYVYHTSRLGAPLQIFHVPIDTPNAFDWEPFIDTNGKKCILGYMGLDGPMPVDSEGAYLIGYHQQDLDGQAISKQWDCSAIPCTCDKANATMYNKWSRHTRLRNILIPGTSFDGSYNLLTTNFINYDSGTNWGLNLSISVRCDLTGIITDNPLLWAQALSKSAAYEMLKVIAYSPRINPSEGGIKQAAMADLDPQIPAAFINDYYNEVSCLNIDLSGFSSACMPEDNEDRIEWGPGI